MLKEIWVDKMWWKKTKFVALAALVVGGFSWSMPTPTVKAEEGCPDLKIIFARGSGAEQNTNDDYIEFRNKIDTKISDTGLVYEFIDLDYPAVGVGMENLKVTVGALVGSGDAYEFGSSVNSGVKKLAEIVNDSCENTKYVLGGYSQGAMVISKSLPSLNAEKIIYAATFGDPKIYLPEGEGLMPAACRGDNLSDYRMYVPDCQAYKGLLGAHIPYEPALFEGKVGTWCNKRDIFCSSHLNMSDHLGYISDNLYEDASRVIASKVTLAFGIENDYTSPHDTAILIDSTGSMERLINKFKNEAVRLANETFESGGRVALYDYRDLRDPYEPVARCDFATCTADNFESYLNDIVVSGGGDEPESMLSASMKVMNELKWQKGATKSLVVLTDAPFLSPDVDLTTVDDVVALSKTIDPVNIYTITDASTAETHPEMKELAEATGGILTTELGALNLLTDYIMERYDTLPRVEEIMDDSLIPTLEVAEVADNGDSVTIKFGGENNGAIITLNEAVLGMISGNSITIEKLNRKVVNRLNLIPVSDSHRGEPAEIELPVIVKQSDVPIEVEIKNEDDGEKNMEPVLVKNLVVVTNEKIDFGGEIIVEKNDIIIPKAPDTSVVK